MTELPDQSDLAENSGPQEYDGLSKSQLKRDSQALQNMGKKLVEMPSISAASLAVKRRSSLRASGANTLSM